MSSQLALVTVTQPNLDHLPLTKLGDIAAAQGFHMDENVRRAGTARDKAIALCAIEPFDSGFAGRATWFGNGALRPVGV